VPRWVLVASATPVIEKRTPKSYTLNYTFIMKELHLEKNQRGTFIPLFIEGLAIFRASSYGAQACLNSHAYAYRFEW